MKVWFYNGNWQGDSRLFIQLVHINVKVDMVYGPTKPLSIVEYLLFFQTSAFWLGYEGISGHGQRRIPEVRHFLFSSFQLGHRFVVMTQAMRGPWNGHAGRLRNSTRDIWLGRRGRIMTREFISNYSQDFRCGCQQKNLWWNLDSSFHFNSL